MWRAILTSALLGLASCAEQTPADGSAAGTDASARATSETNAAPPNVLLITLDTTRADFLSCLGGSAGNTPNIDALAARSTLFTNARSETNVTNPSHLTIMTGLRAIEHGVHGNAVPIPTGLDTLPLLLRRQGYETAGFVAAKHLARDAGWQGFDTFPKVNGVLEAPEVTRRALRWLRGRGTEPFFAWVHYFDAHALYNPPAELAREFYQGDREAGEGPPIGRAEYFEHSPAVHSWLGKTRDPAWPRAMYAAELRHIDDELGRLLEELETSGLADQTLIVLVADHGESMEEHGLYYDHKGLFEPQLHVPLMIHVPGQPARRSDLAVSTLDVGPTIAELVGAAFDHAPSGLSLASLVRGGAAGALEKRETFVYQNAHNAVVSVREGPWKLIWPIDQDHAVLAGPPLLFHLGDDPGELNDLAEGEPERVAAMRARIEPWLVLGVVPGGSGAHLDEESRGLLRALGYTEE